VKAAFAAEAIGFTPKDERLFRQLGIFREMYRKRRPWLAELAGVDERSRFVRVFLEPQVDYMEANGRGSRGVWFRWILSSGRRYEARYPAGWGVDAVTHRFLVVDDDGEVWDVTEEEVRGWLSAGSASTS
jgi:hypothetical protein